MTQECTTCLKNRKNGRLVPVCPACGAIYGVAGGIPWFRCIASFLSRLLVSAAMMIVLLIMSFRNATYDHGGDGKFFSLTEGFYGNPGINLMLCFDLLVLTVWILTGLVPALTDWKNRPVVTALATFGLPALVVIGPISLLVLAVVFTLYLR
jgi:hypothetical protein